MPVKLLGVEVVVQAKVPHFVRDDSVIPSVKRGIFLQLEHTRVLNEPLPGLVLTY